MPKPADLVSLDLKQRKLFIDGEEFPWSISVDGPIFGPLTGSVREVTLTILAYDVEVIAES